MAMISFALVISSAGFMGKMLLLRHASTSSSSYVPLALPETNDLVTYTGVVEYLCSWNAIFLRAVLWPLSETRSTMSAAFCAHFESKVTKASVDSKHIADTQLPLTFWTFDEHIADAYLPLTSLRFVVMPTNFSCIPRIFCAMAVSLMTDRKNFLKD